MNINVIMNYELGVKREKINVASILMHERERERKESIVGE
jgi:hypothetical protein